MVRNLLAYLAALIAGYLVAALAASHAVLGRLAEMGVAVPVADRLAVIGHDLIGMAGAFLPLLAVALAVGFVAAAAVSRILPDWRRVGYVSAGFVAVVAMHLIMREVLGLTPVAAARTFSGLLIQGAAGALAGYVFWRLARRQALQAS